MCGRYALGIRASFVRYQLQQQNLPVDEAPEDDEARESYNFAPGYYGLVYRSDHPNSGRSTRDDTEGDGPEESREPTDQEPSSTEAAPTHKLQAMKWGLVPFWTKRNPDYGTLMKTINCRDDSLQENRGMWTSMKKTKRCIVVAQGFYEWQKKNDGKEKIPHFVKRKDEQLMLMAGLWDRVRYEDSDKDLWTYTIITTDNNKQLSFLHDRMPVILEPNSEEMRKWLDPERTEWDNELQSILRPYQDELDCYAVSKDVGKVGNNSPDFIVPVASKANKQNIANFFEAQREGKKPAGTPIKAETKEKEDRIETPSEEPHLKTRDSPDAKQSNLKRTSAEVQLSHPPSKVPKTEPASAVSEASPTGKKTRDASSNGPRPKANPSSLNATKSKKITNFFAKT